MRPNSISVLCIVLFVIGISQLIGSIGIFWVAPRFLSMIAIIINAIAMYAYYGLWKMQRWGVVGFLGVWVFNLLLSWLVPLHGGIPQQIRSWIILFVILVYLIVVLPHWKKMSRGWSFRF